MKRGSVFITFFLVIVLVIGSAEIVHASDNEKGVETFFIDLFNYLFTPINSPQFSMDIGGGGGGGGVIPACPYDCQSSCSSGQIEAAGSCLTPTVCCRDLNVCGDRYIDFGEDCDGSYLNGESCESKGYLSGTLSCVDCNFNEDNCILKSINLGLKFDFEEGIGNIAIDSSGNGNDGNIIDATYDKNSKVGLFSLNLDGNKDYINVSRSSSLMITDGLTMGAWVYPMNISSGWDYVIAKGFVNNSSPYLDYGLGWYNPYINGMVLRAVITINGSQSIVTSSLLDPNKWHHIVATYSSVDEELAMYVNGYLYNTTKASGIIEDSGTNLFIGMYEHITSESFNGSIDDVRIYDGALSAGEVLDYYNGVAVEVCDDGFCEGSENCSSCPEDCGDCPSISDLVLYMPFEGDFMDYSGNELNGNCFNCPTSTLGYDGNGSAYEFNGINDLITIADNDNLNLTSDFSVLVWTKFNNLMDNDPKTVLSKEHWVSDSENSGYAMEKYGINDLYFINYGNSDAGSNNVNIPTSEREWHHSAITYDYANNLLTFYEDGVEKSNNAAVANILENTNNLHIGASTAPDRWFDGAIDELRIYNRVLSLTEIQNFSLLPIVDCTDADDDGWIFESEGTCDTSAIPALNGYDDCDDGEPLKWNLYDLYNDLDLDSYGAGSVVEQSCWGQITDIEFINYLISNSFSYLDTDCDDNADYNFPNNPEICDGLDNDCGLDVDEGLICECFMEVDCYDSNECTNDFCDLQFINGSLCVNVNLIDGTLCTGGTCQKGECIINCMDIDGDGYNVTGGLCGPIDCNDFNGAINPGAVEICDDLLDNNCNNLTDCDDVSCSDDPVCLNCGDYPAEGSACIDAGCDSCLECSGAQSNGLEGDFCIDFETCSYSCLTGDCGAECNGGDIIESKSCLDNNTFQINTSTCDLDSCSYNVDIVSDVCDIGEYCVAGNCVANNLTVFVWELNKGFNFVSLPLEEFNLVGFDWNYTSNITSEIESAMLGYDADNTKWLVGYGPLDTIGEFMPLRGYIYYANVDTTWVFEGDMLDSPPSFLLVEDSWNLVGVSVTASVDEIYGAGIYTVYEWNGFNYIDVSGSILQTGKAYWVYPGVPMLAPPEFSFWGWITGLFR